MQDYQDTVSVVIPCYNEERFIVKALESLADQYDAERYEIIVVDGLSEDQTRAQILEFTRTHKDISVRIVDNPARNIPTALNLGVQNARGEIIARMDAHAVPPKGYIQRCVEVLNQSGVGAVGMPCHVLPGADTLAAKAIALAVSHPFGIGDAKYRLQGEQHGQESVDTVAFACFKRSLWKAIGGFNEALLTNEDYDFNYRIRRSGYKVILDRGGHSDYFARPTLGELARQYWRYGTWKVEMIRLHPGSIKLRHAAAPIFVSSFVILGALSPIWTPARWLLFLEFIVYITAATAAGCHAIRNAEKRFSLFLLMPLVFATIHLTWGASFLVGLVRGKESDLDDRAERQPSG